MMLCAPHEVRCELHALWVRMVLERERLHLAQVLESSEDSSSRSYASATSLGTWDAGEQEALQADAWRCHMQPLLEDVGLILSCSSSGRDAAGSHMGSSGSGDSRGSSLAHVPTASIMTAPAQLHVVAQCLLSFCEAAGLSALARIVQQVDASLLACACAPHSHESVPEALASSSSSEDVLLPGAAPPGAASGPRQSNIASIFHALKRCQAFSKRLASSLQL